MMNRPRHAQRHGILRGLPPLRTLGILVLMGFVLFVAFRILTPPVKTVLVVAAPDGSREARLQHVYYYSKPGFRISVRETPPDRSPVFNPWNTVFYLPEYTNAPAGEGDGRLRWSGSSSRLYFEIDGVTVWGREFRDQPSRLRSP